MEVTKLSTKGQVVIPDSIRKDMQSGTAFTVTRKDDLIVLKEIKGLTSEEQEELEELNKIWKEIDTGKCKSYEAEDFFDSMKKW